MEPVPDDQAVSVQACDDCGQVARATLWQFLDGASTREGRIVWLCTRCRDKALGLFPDCPAAPSVAREFGD